MDIKIIKVSEIVPYANNPRKISNSVDGLVESIKKFGFRIPVVVDTENVIVAGHVRVEAAKKLGIAEVPCVVVEDLTPEELKAFRLADNQVAAFATWDEKKLKEELDAIGLDMAKYGFEVEKTLKNSAAEINVEDFDDEKFEVECPYCGFRFSEK